MENKTLSNNCNLTSIIGAIWKDNCVENNNETKEYARGHGMAAGWYVIIVIVFYGTSVIFLIASHIKRKHGKIQEDRQINSYLKEFQVVRERSSRDNYKALKKNTIATLSRLGVRYGRDANTSSSALYRCLSKSFIPITALALSAESMTSLHSKNSQRINKKLQPIQEKEEILRLHGSIHSSEDDYMIEEKPLQTIVEIENSTHLSQIENNMENPLSQHHIANPVIDVDDSYLENYPKSQLPKTVYSKVHRSFPNRSMSEETHSITLNTNKQSFAPNRSISTRTYNQHGNSKESSTKTARSEMPKDSSTKSTIEQISSV